MNYITYNIFVKELSNRNTMSVVVNKSLPVDICNIIQSYITDINICEKKKIFIILHKDVKEAVRYLNYYRREEGTILNHRINKIKWVCNYMYVRKQLFYSDD